MSHELDDLDYTIIEALQEDGRTGVAEMARRAGVSEATVRRRLAELVETGVLRVTAVVEPHRVGFQVLVLFLITLDMSRFDEFSKAIANLPEIRFAGFLTGVYDIIAEAWFPSNQELTRFLTETLPQIPGITRCETAHMLTSVKRSHSADQEALALLPSRSNVPAERPRLAGDTRRSA